LTKLYVVDTWIGSFVLNDEGKIVHYKLYPKDIGTIIEEVLKLEEQGFNDLTKTLIDELAEKFDPKTTSIVVEDPDTAKLYADRGFQVVVEAGTKPVVMFREKFFDNLVDLKIFDSREQAQEFLHRVGMELTRRKLRRHAQKRDLLAIQAIRAIDDIDKTLNLFAARLREWYSIHFPELDDLLKEHEDYIKVVAEIGFRDKMSVENLTKLGIGEGKAKRIVEVAQKSIGADLTDTDMEIIRTVASIWMQLYELRGKLTAYLEQVMKEVAPNVTALVGALLGARLLSLAGSLESLARLPASTIQVLGAEKALFRALRTGGKPPKHGVIFQYPEIRRAPRWQRGKIARALATKLAIAARIDFFTGRYVGDELVKKLRERIEEIKKLYPKPPKREEKKAVKPARKGEQKSESKKR